MSIKNVAKYSGCVVGATGCCRMSLLRQFSPTNLCRHGDMYFMGACITQDTVPVWRVCSYLYYPVSHECCYLTGRCPCLACACAWPSCSSPVGTTPWWPLPSRLASTNTLNTKGECYTHYNIVLTTHSVGYSFDRGHFLPKLYI